MSTNSNQPDPLDDDEIMELPDPDVLPEQENAGDDQPETLIRSLDEAESGEQVEELSATEMTEASFDNTAGDPQEQTTVHVFDEDAAAPEVAGRPDDEMIQTTFDEPPVDSPASAPPGAPSPAAGPSTTPAAAVLPVGERRTGRSTAWGWFLLVLVGIASFVGGFALLGGPSWWIYSSQAAQAKDSEQQALEQREAAQRDKQAAEAARTTAEKAQAAADDARQTSEQNQAAAERVARDATAAKTAADTQRDAATLAKEQALKDRETAVDAKLKAEQSQKDAVETARLADEAAKKAKQESDASLVEARRAEQDRKKAQAEAEAVVTAIDVDQTDDINKLRSFASVVEKTISDGSVPPAGIPQRQLVLSRLHLRIASLPALKTDNAARQQELAKASQRAREAEASARKQQDQSLLLDAVYCLGRSHELSGDFKEALLDYERGRTEAADEPGRSRFTAGRARVRLEQLKQGADRSSATGPDVGNPATKAGPPVQLVALQQPQPPAANEQELQAIMADLRLALQEAGKPVPELLKDLAEVQNLMGRQYQGKTDSDSRQRALSLFDEAASSCRQAMASLFNCQDRREGTLYQDLLKQWDAAHQGREQITVDQKTLAYKNLADKYRQAERLLAEKVETIARKLNHPGTLPGEIDRWDSQQTQTVGWLTRLGTRAETVSDELKQGTEKLVTLRREHGEAITDLKTRHKSAMDGLQDSIAPLEQQARLWQRAEQSWGDWGLRLAQAARFMPQLPSQSERWTRQETATEDWMDQSEARIKMLLNEAPINLQAAGLYYTTGLSRFFSRNYSAAVSEFTQAIAHNPRDARYHYFRALSRYALRGQWSAVGMVDSRNCANGVALLPGPVVVEARDETADIRQGVALELRQLPDTESIGAALEKIQGPSRIWFERERTRILRELAALPAEVATR